MHVINTDYNTRTIDNYVLLFKQALEVLHSHYILVGFWNFIFFPKIATKVDRCFFEIKARLDKTNQNLQRENLV